MVLVLVWVCLIALPLLLWLIVCSATWLFVIMVVSDWFVIVCV